MTEAEAAAMEVVHSTYTWLNLTETWIHSQIVNLPDSVRTAVVADTRANTELFPHSDVAAVADAGRAAELVTRALRKSGVRTHTGLLARTLRSRRPAVLHSHFADLGWRNYGLARRLGVPHVVSVYGLDVTMLPREQPRWRTRLGELFADVDLVLCEGPQMARNVIGLGCPPERARVHRLGIDTRRIGFAPRRREPGEPLRLLMAGSFREKKGIPDGITAAGMLARDGVPLELTIIGGGDGPERDRIHAALAASGLGDRVRLLGYQPYTVLEEEARRHHVFLAPSVHAADGDAEGGAPVVVVEMAASGMPVAGTTHCDIPFVIAEPNREYLVPEHDPAALADALRRLLEADWAAIATANRAEIERDADCVAQALRLAGIYAELAAG